MTKMYSFLLILLAVDYGCVLLAVLVDLGVALYKLRGRGERCTSRGLRRTVSKLSSYFAALLSLTLVDAMLVAATLCLEACGGERFIAPFPYLTTLGAVSLGLIELKSVSETTGVRFDLGGTVRFLLSVLKR